MSQHYLQHQTVDFSSYRKKCLITIIWIIWFFWQRSIQQKNRDNVLYNSNSKDYFSNQCCILTFDPVQNTIQGDAPEGSDTFQWEEIAWAETSWWNGTSLKNSHGTLIDWCTGREWPLKCMTVISAWWRLNIRFQRSSGRRTII